MDDLERVAKIVMVHLVDEGGMPFEEGDEIPQTAIDIARDVLLAFALSSATIPTDKGRR